MSGGGICAIWPRPDVAGPTAAVRGSSATATADEQTGRGASNRPSHRARAQILFNQRRARSRCFGAHAKVFQEAPWDILLELFLHHEDGSISPTTTVAYDAGVPRTTALRALKKLKEIGLVTSWADPADRRVRRIGLTATAVAMMRRYLDEL